MLNGWCLIRSTKNLFKDLQKGAGEGPGVILVPDAELLQMRDGELGVWERSFLLQVWDIFHRCLPHLATKAPSTEILNAISRQYFVAVIDAGDGWSNPGCLASFTQLDLDGPCFNEIRERIAATGSMLRQSHSPSFDATKVARAAHESSDPQAYIDQWITGILRRNSALADEFSGDQGLSETGKPPAWKLTIRNSPKDRYDFIADCCEIEDAIGHHGRQILTLSRWLLVVKEVVSDWLPDLDLRIETNGIGFNCAAINGDRGALLEVSLAPEFGKQPTITLYFKPPGSPDYQHHKTFSHISSAIRAMQRLLKVNP